jgi:hypothetical protein
MTTCQDVLYGALRQISSVTPGEAIEGTEASNGLTVINRLLAAFSMEWGLIQDVTVENFPLVVGQTSYTWGIGGNFNSVRPDKIFNCWLYDSLSGIRYPLKMLSDNQYQAIPLNNIQSIVKAVYYDPQYPLGILNLYPTASLTTYILYTETYKPMAQFATLTSTMNLPGEYFEELVMLTADELAPEYGYELNQRQLQKVEYVKDLMKARNFKRAVAGFDAAVNGGGRQTGGTILDGFIS